MKVKQLLELLQNANPDAGVVIADNGSILPTAKDQDTIDYNTINGADEFFIVTEEWNE